MASRSMTVAMTDADGDTNPTTRKKQHMLAKAKGNEILLWFRRAQAAAGAVSFEVSISAFSLSSRDLWGSSPLLA
jgi:hypothetical protein